MICVLDFLDYRGLNRTNSFEAFSLGEFRRTSCCCELLLLPKQKQLVKSRAIFFLLSYFRVCMNVN